MTEQNRQYILELYKIVSTTSIMVIDREGKLKRLKCPFKVVAVVAVHQQIIAGAFYWVDFVKMTLELQEIYIIQGKGYFIYYFKIM